MVEHNLVTLDGDTRIVIVSSDAGSAAAADMARKLNMVLSSMPELDDHAPISVVSGARCDLEAVSPLALNAAGWREADELADAVAEALVGRVICPLSGEDITGLVQHPFEVVTVDGRRYTIMTSIEVAGLWLDEEE